MRIKRFIVGFKDDYNETVIEHVKYPTKSMAVIRRRELQHYGYTKVFIKKRNL